MRRRRGWLPEAEGQRRARGQADVSPRHEGPPPGSSRDPAHDRIAAAMVQLIGSRGYEATAIETVCERAGVERADFDRRFAGKEDCFLVLHEEIAAELCRRGHPALAGPAGSPNQIWGPRLAAPHFLPEAPSLARVFL